MSDFLFQNEDDMNAITQDTNIQKPGKFWHILIVDDKPKIHNVTCLILKNSLILDRKLILHSAYSAQGVKQLLQSDIEFSMGFIGVVMENNHAGLYLINWIREDIENDAICLILRTAQAGNASEEYVISQYDILDYKTN